MELLESWRHQQKFTLLEGAALLGPLSNPTKTCRWARPRHFAFQCAFGCALAAKCHQVEGHCNCSNREASIIANPPNDLLQRLDQVITQEKAQLLWHARTQVAITSPMCREIQCLHECLAEARNPWEVSISHITPRQPTHNAIGDACKTSRGACSEHLCCWMIVDWAPDLVNRTRLGKNHPKQIHIDCLEFAVIVLQLAAVGCGGWGCRSGVKSTLPLLSVV